MGVLVQTIVALQWAMMIYFPAVVLYGLLRIVVQEEPLKTVNSPFFGIKNVGLKRGCLIWAFQLVLCGATLIEYVKWYRFGINPFIPF